MALTPTPPTRPSDSFAQIVAPLERASGSRLGNPHREECLRAFQKFPDGVRAIARSALADSERNPVGLFFYRIRNGWHELEPLPEEPAPPEGSETASSRPAARRRPRRYVLQVDRDDGVRHEKFSDLETYERRAADLERELGAHNVTRLST